MSVGVNTGGLYRCCAQAIPILDDGNPAASFEGDHRKCAHCKVLESGVIFTKGCWIAAWRKNEEN